MTAEHAPAQGEDGEEEQRRLDRELDLFLEETAHMDAMVVLLNVFSICGLNWERTSLALGAVLRAMARSETYGPLPLFPGPIDPVGAGIGAPSY
jgi:hypothetical protein